MRRAVVIFARFRQGTDLEHPNAREVEWNYRGLLVAMGLEEAEVIRRVSEANGGTPPALRRPGDIGNPPAEP